MKCMEIVLGVPIDECLSIDDEAGCTIRIRQGEVWITSEGWSSDIIAKTGGGASLGGPNRTIIGASRDAVIDVALPHDARDATFELSFCGNARRLKVSTPSSWLGKLARRFGVTGTCVVPCSFPVIG